MAKRKVRGPRRSPQSEPEGLTPKQFALLHFIQDFQKHKGYSPTMQEMADRFAVTKVTIFEHLDALQRKGWLHRGRYRARSLEFEPGIKLPKPQPSETGLPLAGYIAAGKPIEAVADNQQIELDAMFPRRHNTFVLKVRGDSMIDEHIADGDYVIIEQKAEPRDGQTVVALIENNEATLKKFYREGAKVRLQPANAAYPPILADADKVNIQGVVVGVVRKFKD